MKEIILLKAGEIALKGLNRSTFEDRLVKNFMRTGNFEGDVEKDFFGRVATPWRLVTGKPVVPDDAEIERNPRSRSAKLRVAEKITDENTQS